MLMEASDPLKKWKKKGRGPKAYWCLLSIEATRGMSRFFSSGLAACYFSPAVASISESSARRVPLREPPRHKAGQGGAGRGRASHDFVARSWLSPNTCHNNYPPGTQFRWPARDFVARSWLSSYFCHNKYPLFGLKS